MVLDVGGYTPQSLKGDIMSLGWYTLEWTLLVLTLIGMEIWACYVNLAKEKGDASCSQLIRIHIFLQGI